MNKVGHAMGSSGEMTNCCNVIRDKASEVKTYREGLCIIPKIGWRQIDGKYRTKIRSVGGFPCAKFCTIWKTPMLSVIIIKG